MLNIPPLFFVILLLGLNCSCDNFRYHTDEQYNPETQQIEKTNYTDYYRLDATLHDKHLQIVMVTNINREALRAMYQLKQVTRRLLPNDYMLPSDVNLYLTNSGEDMINLELIAVNIENRNLPLSQRKLRLKAKDSVALYLGRVPVDIRLLSLNTTIEYISEEHREKAFDMKRLVHYDKDKASK